MFSVTGIGRPLKPSIEDRTSPDSVAPISRPWLSDKPDQIALTAFRATRQHGFGKPTFRPHNPSPTLQLVTSNQSCHCQASSERLIAKRHNVEIRILREIDIEVRTSAPFFKFRQPDTLASLVPMPSWLHAATGN